MFCQTALYLTPIDLLELSRLSKQFRSMFTSRSAIFVWRTVFRNANVKCPGDLNELEFATLCHDRCCMVQLLFPFCYPHQLYSCLFMFLSRHADVRGKNAHYFRPFVWDCVQAVKMQSKNCPHYSQSLPPWLIFFPIVWLLSMIYGFNIQTPWTYFSTCLIPRLGTSSLKLNWWSKSFYLWRKKTLASSLLKWRSTPGPDV